MKFSRLAAVALLLFFTCSVEAANRYRIEAYSFEKPIVFSKGEYAAKETHATGRVLSPESAAPLLAAIADPKIEKFAFPRVEMEAGGKVSVDNQKDFSFVDAYDSDGKPTHHGTHVIGPRIQIVLTEVGTQSVSLDIDTKNDVFEKYITHASDSGTEIKQPSFVQRGFKTKVALHEGYWIVVNGPEGGLTFALRVTRVTPQ